MQPGSRVDILLKVDTISNIIAIVGDKSPYTGGKFDVYVNDTFRGTVNTQVLTYNENKALTGTKLYQRILISLPQLIEKSQERETFGQVITDMALVSLRCKEGNPTVAGFVGPIIGAYPIPGFDYASHPIPGDPPLEATVVPIEELEPRYDAYDPDFIPVAPVDENKTEEFFENQTDNSGNTSTYQQVEPTATPNGFGIFEADPTTKSKTPGIVGGVMGGVVVVTAAAVATVFILRARKAAKIPMTDDALVGGGGYDI